MADQEIAPRLRMRRSFRNRRLLEASVIEGLMTTADTRLYFPTPRLCLCRFKGVIVFLESLYTEGESHLGAAQVSVQQATPLSPP